MTHHYFRYILDHVESNLETLLSSYVKHRDWGRYLDIIIIARVETNVYVYFKFQKKIAIRIESRHFIRFGSVTPVKIKVKSSSQIDWIIRKHDLVLNKSFIRWKNRQEGEDQEEDRVLPELFVVEPSRRKLIHYEEDVDIALRQMTPENILLDSSRPNNQTATTTTGLPMDDAVDYFEQKPDIQLPPKEEELISLSPTGFLLQDDYSSMFPFFSLLSYLQK